MSDISVRLNAAELAALAGLPSLAVVAYVLGIRPWMDYRTGIVGIIRGVSWQSIREAIEVEGHQGMARQSFSRDQVQRAVAHLEKRGLLTRNSTGDSLIFRANFATQDNGVQKKAAPMSAPMSAPIAEAETRATTGIPALPTPKATPKAATKAAPPPAYPLTTITSPPSSTVVGGGEGEELIFHPAIRPEYQPAIKTALQGIAAEQRQTAVDELAGVIVARAGTANPIRSQLAYLRAILGDMRGGGFIPAHATDIERARINEAARKTRDAARVSEIEKQAASGPRFRPGVSLADHLKGLNS